MRAVLALSALVAVATCQFLDTPSLQSGHNAWPEIKIPDGYYIHYAVYTFNQTSRLLTPYEDLRVREYFDMNEGRSLSFYDFGNASRNRDNDTSVYVDFEKQYYTVMTPHHNKCETKPHFVTADNIAKFFKSLKNPKQNITSYHGLHNAPFSKKTKYHKFQITLPSGHHNQPVTTSFYFTVLGGKLRYIHNEARNIVFTTTGIKPRVFNDAFFSKYMTCQKPHPMKNTTHHAIDFLQLSAALI